MESYYYKEESSSGMGGDQIKIPLQSLKSLDRTTLCCARDLADPDLSSLTGQAGAQHKVKQQMFLYHKEAFLSMGYSAAAVSCHLSQQAVLLIFDCPSLTAPPSQNTGLVGFQLIKKGCVYVYAIYWVGARFFTLATKTIK